MRSPASDHSSEGLDLAGVVVTADALHAQRERARFSTDPKRGGHYVVGVKGNQPRLANAAIALLQACPIVARTHDRGHGRIEHRAASVAQIPRALARELGFPSAAQFIAVERSRSGPTRDFASIEIAQYVTDLTSAQASPEHLATYIRGHWGVENRSHYVRDRTFDEDRCQVRTGSGPQVLTTLRNLAISMLRLRGGFKNIAAGLRWVAWDHERGLSLLGV